MAGYGGLTGWVDEENPQVAAQAAAEAAAAIGRRGYGSLRPADLPAPVSTWGGLGDKIGKLVQGIPAAVAHVAGLPAAMVDAQRRQAGAYGEITDSDPDPAKVGAEIATNLAGMGSMSFGSLAPKGSVGIFGGRLAKTADHEALARAEDMAAKGAFPGEIHAATGWFQGADKKWRFEIPDQAATINEAGLPTPHRLDVADQYLRERGHRNGVGGYGTPEAAQTEALKYADKVIEDTTVPMAGYLHHKPLYDAYPEMRNVSVGRQTDPQLAASFEPAKNLIRVGEGSLVANTSKRSSVLHESQHKVQEIEDFARGAHHGEFNQQADAKLASDALAFRRELDRHPKGMDSHAKENAVIEEYQKMGAMDWVPSREVRDLAHDRINNPDGQLRQLQMRYGLHERTTPYTSVELYKKHAGEVEARNVQKRADWDDAKRREIPPEYSQDTETGKQIIRYGSQGKVERPFGSLAPQGSAAPFDWNLARQAEGALSPKAANAMDSWVGVPFESYGKVEPGGYPWHPSKLVEALSHPEIGPEITKAFQPVREALRAQHGDTVPVYRYSGGAPEGSKPHDLLSFTTDRRVAEGMSGAARKPAPIYTDAEIAAKEAEFAKSGEIKIGGHTLKKGEGGYLDIFDRDGGHVTDTGGVREYMQQKNGWAREDNTERAAKLAKVGEHRIPVDDIVAVTDRAGQREIIARNRGGLYANGPGGAPLSMAPRRRDE